MVKTVTKLIRPFICTMQKLIFLTLTWIMSVKFDHMGKLNNYKKTLGIKLSHCEITCKCFRSSYSFDKFSSFLPSPHSYAPDPFFCLSYPSPYIPLSHLVIFFFFSLNVFFLIFSYWLFMILLYLDYL